MAKSGSRAKTRFLILGLLSTEGPLSGYEVRTLTRVRFQYFWNESFGQIYPELDRLVKEGLVAPMGEPSEAQGRKIKRYRITDPGRKILRDWLKEPAEIEMNRYEMLLKVYFGGAGDPVEVLEQIGAFRARYETASLTLMEFEREVENLVKVDPGHLNILLTILFGRRVFDAYLQWADEAAALIEKSRTVQREDLS